MREMKYVVVNNPELGDQIFIFPKSVNHKNFAEILSHIKHEDASGWRRLFRKPVSAGFTDGVRCFGKSESLNLISRPEVDTKLLKD